MDLTAKPFHFGIYYVCFPGSPDTLTIVTDSFKCDSRHCQAVPRPFLS